MVLNLYHVYSMYISEIVRAARHSKIYLDIVLSCLNIQNDNRYNIYIQFSIQYQDFGVKNVKNLFLS